MSFFTRIIGILVVFIPLFIVSAADYPVGITKDTPTVNIIFQKEKVTIKRIQDPANRLVDDFAKTSRKCPPFCIHPMSAAKGVKTVGELELLNFLENEVHEKTGFLIDARMPKFYKSETIPGSVNIPFVIFDSPNKEELLFLLGVKKVNEKLDFTSAKKLLLYCNGPWCDQSPRAIKALIKVGYPTSKLLYYRGGMQLWKLFSLTTLIPSTNNVGE